MPVTEAQWRTCSDPDRMLDYLLARERHPARRLLAMLGFPTSPAESAGPRISARKLRLFAVACCDRLETLWRDERSREAVSLSADYADSQVGEAELSAAQTAAWLAVGRIRPTVFAEYVHVAGGAGLPTGKSEYWAARAAAEVAGPDNDALLRALADVGRAAVQMITESPDLAASWAAALGAAARADLLREIAGNPCVPSTLLPPAVLDWNDGTVRRIAEGIVVDRAYARLPILADALLDAGCDNEELLAHCRSAGPHVRGCWGLDLVRGLG